MNNKTIEKRKILNQTLNESFHARYHVIHRDRSFFSFYRFKRNSQARLHHIPLYSFSTESGNGIINLKNLHFRHIFIFSCQPSWTFPWHIVPLINQQSCPACNSHAGQFCLTASGHFFITQQGSLFLLSATFAAIRKSSCRST